MRAKPDILCIGAAHWDVIGRSLAAISPGADLPGTISTRPGGVALNVAQAVMQHGMRSGLLSVIGRDSDGEALVAWLVAQGVETQHLHRPNNQSTDRYLAVEGPQGLGVAIADSRALEGHSTALLAPLTDHALRDWRGPVLVDSGLAPATLASLARTGLPQARPLHVTSAAPAKADRLRPFLESGAVFAVNRQEAQALLDVPLTDSGMAARALLDAGARRAIVTDGPGPVTDADHAQTISETPPAVCVQRVTGAGDNFLAAHMAAEWRGLDRRAALAYALEAAARHITTQEL